eukprot:GHUV01020039.1.p1 GENE.GHUV01020039.1~~GHUV01020039.1.p1  ORF type:complete len:169 (-),score=19.82 GHUV01020039.1:474-980(-)
MMVKHRLRNLSLHCMLFLLARRGSMTIVLQALSPYFSTPSINASICSVVHRVLRDGVRPAPVAVVYAADARASSTSGTLSSSSGTYNNHVDRSFRSLKLNSMPYSMPTLAVVYAAEARASSTSGTMSSSSGTYITSFVRNLVNTAQSCNLQECYDVRQHHWQWCMRQQ